MVYVSNYVIDFVCTYQYIKELDESELLYRTQLITSIWSR